MNRVDFRSETGTVGEAYHLTCCGEMSERLKEHDWKSCRRLYRLEGSNPSLSAIPKAEVLSMRTLLLLVALVASAGSAGAADKPDAKAAKKDSTEALVETHHQITAG